MSYKTEQENFWAGDFGNEYIKRNRGEEFLSSKIAIFRDVLKYEKIESCLEFGANIGLNLQAVKLLMPNVKLSAIEINPKAVEELKIQKNIEVFAQSILEFESDRLWELTFVSGVLIHINPDMLKTVYASLYKHSSKYILVAEYYNPTPVELDYRGNRGKLFKRDFAGELMDMYNDLQLVDYGFCYHRDTAFPADDINWFLLKKS